MTTQQGVQFQILGPLRAYNVDGELLKLGGASQRRLLATLITHANTVVPAERLADWCGLSPGSLRTAISRLRRVLGAEAIVSEPLGYSLRTGQLDADLFVELAEQARQANAAEALVLLEQALALWRGDALVDVAYESWAQPSAVRLTELRTACIEDHAERLLELGRWSDVIAAMEAHIIDYPLRDRPRELLVRGLAANGRQADALRAYQAYRTYLGDESGTEPSDDLRAVESKIATGWRDRVPDTAATGPRPDHSLQATTGLVTFLFTDIANNAMLWEADKDTALNALGQHDHIVLSSVANHEGRVVRQTGDGVVAAFEQPLAALHAALDAQLRLADAFDDAPLGLRVRMGIHSGIALARGGDYLGRTVSRSERIMTAASGGQILCSAAAAEVARDDLPELFELTELDSRLLPSTDDLAGVHLLRHPDLAAAAIGPGETLRGIRIGTPVSTNSLGELWSGVRTSDDRKVLVRILHREEATSAQFSRRFELDSHLLQQFHHPGAEDLIDAWQDGAGAYLVFSQNRASSLAEDVHRVGPPDHVRLCAIVREIAAVLEAAHRRRLAHGRISLDSIHFDEAGSVLVTGFSIGGVGLTSLDLVAPELRAINHPTDRSDIYSLGVLVHQLMVGSVPHVDPATDQVLLADSFNTATADSLKRAMAVRPIDRYSSATEFVDELERSLGQTPSRSSGALDISIAAVPPTLGHIPAAGFIGRADELAAVETAWDQALMGQTQRVILSGEAGVGKSAIAAEAAREASDVGALVLHGACLESLRAPYQPVASAIREYLARADTARTTEHVQSDALELILQPHPGERYQEPAARSALVRDSSTVVQEIARWFCELASQRPIFFVVDDIQWADAESVAVLEQIHTWSGPHRICVVLTHRTTEAESPGKRLATGSRRDSATQLVAVDGVSRDDVSAFLRASTRDVARFTSAHDWVINAIHEETAGNALFVSELVRHLTDTGRIATLARSWKPAERVAELGIPETVRDVVASRIAMLTDAARALLPSAAVLGTVFDARLWRMIANGDSETFITATEELLASGLLVEQPGAADNYQFAHAIIQSTIYQGLTSLRRSHLHRAAALALETHDPQPIDDLAIHFTAGAADGDSDKALVYNAAAATGASRRFAYMSAARHLAATLALADSGIAKLAESERIDTLIELGIAQRQAGNHEFRSTLFDAANRAASAKDEERLVRATLANRSTLYSVVNGVDHERIRGLQRALTCDAALTSVRRALLLSQYALELTFTPETKERLLLSDDALSMARESGDADVLATVLVRRHATLVSPAMLIDRNPICDELDGLADRITDPILAFMGAQSGWITRSQHGDSERTEAALQSMTEQAEATRQPAPRWRSLRCRAADAAMTGDLQRAERLARQSLAVGLAAGMDDLWTYFGPQMFGIRFLQGRMPEIADSAAQDATNDLPPFIAGLAFLFAEIGQLDRSEAMLLRLFGPDFESRTMLTHGPLTTLAAATMANARIENTEWAERLGAMWTPYHDRCVSETPAFWGAAHHHIGLIERTLGKLDQACAHFELAVDTHERIGSPPWAALSQLEWAIALKRHGDSVHEQHAERLLGRAAATARAFRLQGILRRLDE